MPSKYREIAIFYTMILKIRKIANATEYEKSLKEVFSLIQHLNYYHI